MQVVFINKCKSCEISNQMSFIVMFSFSKSKGKLVETELLQNKLFSGAICMMSLINQRRIKNSVRHLRWSIFAKMINGYKVLTIFAKKYMLDLVLNTPL